MATPLYSLGVLDYIVCGVVLLVSAGIGVFYGCTGKKQNTTQEFLMADRQMPFIPVALSLLASFMSAITLLGTPAEMYTYGTEYWLIWIGYCGTIAMAAHIYHPVFFKLQLTSVFEYLEMRFCRGLRLYGAIMYIVQMILYMSIVLYAPSLALNAVTGLNVWVSVFSVGVVCTFYTSLGGIKAVMWTDVFQICMMFAGFIAILIAGSIDYGGFHNIWDINDKGGRIHFLTWDPNPLVRHTVWSVIFGGAFTWLSVYGTNQSQVQRALTCKRVGDAQKAMWINLPGLSLLLTVCGLSGLVVYAQYQDCDPLKSKRILASDQLLPLYVIERFHTIPGFSGLFVACIFSGALSTLSSGLNSLSAVTLQDILRLYIFKNWTEAQSTRASKILALIYGVIAIALTFVAANLGSVLQAALGLFGMIGGPILGLYTLGMIYPWSNWKGGYAGFTTGLVLTLWVGIGAQVYKPYVPKAPISITGCPFDNSTMLNMTTPAGITSSAMMLETTTAAMRPEDQPGYLSIYEMSYLWYSAFAVLTTTVSGLIVSLLTGPTNPKDVDPDLMCPLLANIFFCVSEKTKRALSCSVGENFEPKKKKVPTATLR